jgi:hypothetical protein
LNNLIAILGQFLRQIIVYICIGDITFKRKKKIAKCFAVLTYAKTQKFATKEKGHYGKQSKN